MQSKRKVLLKSKKKKTSCYLGWLKCLPFPSGCVMIDFIAVISGLRFVRFVIVIYISGYRYTVETLAQTKLN